MYSETEQKGFAAYELFVMAVRNGAHKNKINVTMIGHDDHWSMTVEDACRGAVMSALEGKVERANCYLAPVIRWLAPESHDTIECIRKLAEHYHKEKNETINCNNGLRPSNWMRCS